MQVHKHRCVTQKVGANHPLAGKKVYIPDMAEGSVKALCAVGSRRAASWYSRAASR
jgi:hypothetical protein